MESEEQYTCTDTQHVPSIEGVASQEFAAREVLVGQIGSLSREYSEVHQAVQEFGDSCIGDAITALTENPGDNDSPSVQSVCVTESGSALRFSTM